MKDYNNKHKFPVIAITFFIFTISFSTYMFLVYFNPSEMFLDYTYFYEMTPPSFYTYLVVSLFLALISGFYIYRITKDDRFVTFFYVGIAYVITCCIVCVIDPLNHQHIEHVKLQIEKNDSITRQMEINDSIRLYKNKMKFAKKNEEQDGERIMGDFYWNMSKKEYDYTARKISKENEGIIINNVEFLLGQPSYYQNKLYELELISSEKYYINTYRGKGFGGSIHDHDRYDYMIEKYDSVKSKFEKKYHKEFEENTEENTGYKTIWDFPHKTITLSCPIVENCGCYKYYVKINIKITNPKVKKIVLQELEQEKKINDSIKEIKEREEKIRIQNKIKIGESFSDGI